MTDRVLTDDEVVTYERLAMQHGSQPRILAKPCVELCVSHRLLQQRVTELEDEVLGWQDAFGAAELTPQWRKEAGRE